MYRPMHRSVGLFAAIAIFVTGQGIAVGHLAPAGGWPWPVTGPVIRAFDPPASPYAAGHRGIDIGAPAGSTVSAPSPGVVYFAGLIGSDIFLGIDHGGGLRTTYSWLNGLPVAKGQTVTTGQPIAYSGWGHPSDPQPSLHFAVKLNGQYVDPLSYLLPLQITDLIRLAPL